MRSQWWFGAGTGLVIPTGVILGFDGVSVPDGYTVFTDADGRVLLGTTTTDVGATGGSNLIFSNYTSYSGSHVGSLSPEISDRGHTGHDTGSNYYNPSDDTSSYGSHRHTLSAYYYPKTDNIVLIKATADNRGLPSGAIVFSTVSVAELNLFSTFNNNNGILEANSSIGVTAASSSVGLGNASYNHNHEVSSTNSAWSLPPSAPTSIDSGGPSHGHSWTPPMSYAKKVVLLRALKAAVDISKVSSSFIVLFDGTTVPDGWFLCDGSNGTPNMSDRYIESHADGDGSTSGTTHSASVSEVTGPSSHGHSSSGSKSNPASAPIPHSSSVSHTHPASGSNAAFYPPWFKMKFIMLEV